MTAVKGFNEISYDELMDVNGGGGQFEDGYAEVEIDLGILKFKFGGTLKDSHNKSSDSSSDSSSNGVPPYRYCN